MMFRVRTLQQYAWGIKSHDALVGDVIGSSVLETVGIDEVLGPPSAGRSGRPALGMSKVPESTHSETVSTSD